MFSSPLKVGTKAVTSDEDLGRMLIKLFLEISRFKLPSYSLAFHRAINIRRQGEARGFFDESELQI